MKKATIKQNPDKEISTEILAQSIVDISDGMEKLLNGRLNRTALVILIQNAITGNISRAQISDVLDAVADLKKKYVRR